VWHSIDELLDLIVFVLRRHGEVKDGLSFCREAARGGRRAGSGVHVLEGELEHVVNGKSYRLQPGMVGYVRPPDRVRHKVGPAGPGRS
jgi:hypothetical protein